MPGTSWQRVRSRLTIDQAAVAVAAPERGELHLSRVLSSCPRSPATPPARRAGAISSASRVSIITAYSSVAGFDCWSTFFSALGCGPCVKPPGMQRDHAGMDVVAAEEIARVIENDFVVVVVVVEERHLHRARVGLERPRHEGADDEAVARRTWCAPTAAGDSDGS